MAAPRERPVLEYAGAAAIAIAAILLCLVLRERLATIDVAMLLLVAVVAAAARFRRGAALLASGLSILAFDFFFVPPYYRLSVHDTDYYLTFGVMLVVAVIMSGLTSRIREEADEAGEREARTAALLAMEGELAAAGDSRSLVAAAARHLERAAHARAQVLLSPTAVPVALPPLDADGYFETAASRVAATWAWESGVPAGWSTSHCSEAEVLVAPLRGAGTTLGLIALKPGEPGAPLRDADRETVAAMTRLAGQALERQRLAEQGERARVEVEAERLRTALLSSLSHDLRTPLAGIEGAATSLLEGTTTIPAEVERELLDGIVSESRRMTRLVTNLLDMIRVETGALALEKSWQPLEEPLGVALLRMEERLRGHPVSTRLPTDLPLVPVDELLLEHVFLNLLENAARHTPPGTPIDVSATDHPGHVLVEVADRGPGIAAEDRERIFDRFYRGRKDREDGGAGSGLGLTICRGIVTAHGGRIWVDPREGGGTCVRFTLPLSGAPPAGLPAESGEGER
jgi:two-component system sensor histidine kinase KdpD